MRTLILMRHANAKGHHESGDKARELSTRGRIEARNAGLALANAQVQHVLCSSAVRTRQTYQELGLKTPENDPIPVEFMDALYSGGVDIVLQRIGEIDDTVNTLLVIGHAPTIPMLSERLAYASLGREADALRCHFPTASFTQYSVPSTWSTFAGGDFSNILHQRTHLPGRG